MSAETCSIDPDERVSLTDPRLRDCAFQPGTRITIYYDTSKGAGRMRPTKHAPAEAAGDLAAPEPVGPPAPAASTVATVGVPTTATDELSRLVSAGGEMSALSLVLAVIAVLGGGAAWKFYSQRSRERHELAMREMELRAAGGPGQSAECRADAAALREQAQRIEARLVQLEERQRSLALPSVPDDLEERLEKLERAGKATARRGKAKS